LGAAAGACCPPGVSSGDAVAVVPPRKGSIAGAVLGAVMERDQQRCTSSVAAVTAATGGHLTPEHLQLLAPSAAVPVQSSP
jgi:hypothetical protein